MCFLKKSVVSQVTTRDLSTSDGLRRGTSSPTPKAETYRTLLFHSPNLRLDSLKP